MLYQELQMFAENKMVLSRLRDTYPSKIKVYNPKSTWYFPNWLSKLPVKEWTGDLVIQDLIQLLAGYRDKLALANIDQDTPNTLKLLRALQDRTEQIITKLEESQSDNDSDD